jgi:hypothetical protein
LPSRLPNVLPPLQLNFIRRTSRNCLANVKAGKITVSPPPSVIVSNYSQLHFLFSSLSLSLSSSGLVAKKGELRATGRDREREREKDNVVFEHSYS